MVRDEHAPSPRPLSPAPLSDMSQVASSLSAHSWKDAFAEAAEASIGVVTGSRSISLSQPRLFSGALPIPDELTELDFSEEDMTLCNGMVKEAPRLVRMAVPLAATNVISYAIGLVTVGFAGRLGEQELAIAVLATSLFNVTGLSILSGFNAALETFCGQFYGAGNYRQVRKECCKENAHENMFLFLAATVPLPLPPLSLAGLCPLCRWASRCSAPCSWPQCCLPSWPGSGPRPPWCSTSWGRTPRSAPGRRVT